MNLKESRHFVKSLRTSLIITGGENATFKREKIIFAAVFVIVSLKVML